MFFLLFVFFLNVFVHSSIRMLFNIDFLLGFPARLVIHACRAMDSVRFHSFVLVDMLRPETMVFPEYNSHAQQKHRREQKYDGNQNGFHKLTT